MLYHDEWRDEETLLRQVLAIETERNEHRRGIAWQFTSRDARRKLERLYPVKESSSDEGERVSEMENPSVLWRESRPSLASLFLNGC